MTTTQTSDGFTPQAPPRTVPETLDRGVTLFSDRPLLGLVEGEPITYAEFRTKVREHAETLTHLGVGHGDRVAVFSENRPEWALVYFAASSLGAVLVPILPDFHPSSVLHILRHSGAKVLMASERCLAKLEELNQQHLTVIVLDDFRILPPESWAGWAKEVIRSSFKDRERLQSLARHVTGHGTPATPKEDDLASIVYTSGTTGRAKGVMLTHRNVVSDAWMTRELVDLGPQDRMLSILPLAHTMEFTLGLLLPMMHGTQIRYLGGVPSPQLLMDAMAKIRPTFMLSVPLVIEKIFKRRIQPKLTGSAVGRTLYRFDASRKMLHKLAGKKMSQSFGGSLRGYCIGGAPLSVEAETFLREAGFPYAMGYGLTEASPLVAGTGAAGVRRRSSGRALNGVEIRIAVQQDSDQAPHVGRTQDGGGVVGEIQVRGPNVMQGYYQEPELTAEVFTEDGWLRTGDLGTLDKDGYLFIRGRLKNLILGPSGENIYPEEVENVLNEQKYVMESLAFELDGKVAARVFLDYDRLDEEVSWRKMSEFEARKYVTTLLETIRTRANAELASFARINKIIEQTEAFEKTPTHKIKRYLYTSASPPF
ncbi:AMP-binding protein [Desulfonatronum thioautotrophicum]|uniref:AMP-binding protein n=1 Tax=Desulfonatronum thioautotrophicum TaxID=617001 RepID=UPI0005EBCDB2|nr:AMP-binding protein [Desulfonatronum thioautotrophicum]